MKSVDLVSKSQFCKVINILLHVNFAFIYYTDSHILSLNIDFFLLNCFNLSDFVLLIEVCVLHIICEMIVTIVTCHRLVQGIPKNR